MGPWLVILTVLWKLTDFSTLQAVMYTVNVVMSWKWCRVKGKSSPVLVIERWA